LPHNYHRLALLRKENRDSNGPVSQHLSKRFNSSMMMRALCSKKEKRRKKKEFNIFCQDLEDEIIKDKEAKKIV